MRGILLISAISCCWLVQGQQDFSQSQAGNFDFFGGDYPSNAFPAKDGPAPCCVPDQYEGKFTVFARKETKGRKNGEEDFVDSLDKRRKGGHSTKTTDVAAFGTLHFDYTNKQVAVDEVVKIGGGRRDDVSLGKGGRGGRSLNLTMIALYSSNTVYLANLDKQRCRKIVWKCNSTSQMKFHCLPPNITYVGNPTYGLQSSGLSTNVWGFRFGRRRMDDSENSQTGADDTVLTFDKKRGGCGRGKHGRGCSRSYFAGLVVTTSNQCVPVFESMEGRTRNKKFGFSASFFDNTLGIASTSAFTPPSFCNTTHTDLMVENDEDLAEIVDDDEIGIMQEYLLVNKYSVDAAAEE